MKNISKLSKSLFKAFPKNNNLLVNSSTIKKTFSQKIKFDYEDPLNLNSLLTEEETMVNINLNKSQ